MNKHAYVIIMAGGIGSRFWPVSRADKPKQFLDILNTGKTLIQHTYDRFLRFMRPENIQVITHHQYVPLVREQLPDLPEENILAEPSRKNTAPCIAYASFRIYKQDPHANLLFAPADHLILEETSFTKTCLEAFQFVNGRDALLTFGIKPTRPDTGYGYIQYEPQKSIDHIFKVKTFTEKPDLELAKTFLKSGDFLWNAGIFAWDVRKILEAFQRLQPEMYELFSAASEAMLTPEEPEVMEMTYAQCTNISIDYAIMEKAENVYVIPSDFGWSDLGTWNSAYENMPRDYLENAVAARDVLIVDATRCMVHSSSERLLVLQGLDDFIVVDTPDVLLICKKNREQEIKEYVAEVKRNIGEKYL
ncbi:mannose-1-phosphate guanylyltransferase [Thermoflavifilum aggregans]|uniref:mannose-1-phosphate guanylyltransferase n=1 Tax=Thermoflavifilum aggregans TaxID=454188 RepID=A0A2M9CRQ5_9BACT|nr:mannose-1-phosphate guanylyltransferase [Thermoflavifilum aggregans]MBX6380410.1 NTP transferase domain-containing protein [Thermoflavifilum aggregans]PJJ74594.1 mannose-1-phosphate guanylyltransferase [Thermoflavifilum aggregans]